MVQPTLAAKRFVMQPNALHSAPNGMLPRTYDDQNCSVARALEVLGDRWTLLVIRDAFLGVHRFDDFQRDLGVARNVLSDRLQRLVDEGLLERHRYQERPERFEYRLSAKGTDLWPAIVTLMKWGDRYYAPEGPPRLVRHRGCGGEVTANLTCATCGRSLTALDAYSEPGPGATTPPLTAAEA
jgi:DNA-binding HxlR family transcriptional regulator